MNRPTKDAAASAPLPQATAHTGPMSLHAQVLGHVVPTDACSSSRSAIATGGFILACASVAACAAVAFLLSLTTALPGKGIVATQAQAGLTPLHWPDSRADSSLPTAGTRPGDPSQGLGWATDESAAADEAAPTF